MMNTLPTDEGTDVLDDLWTDLHTDYGQLFTELTKPDWHDLSSWSFQELLHMLPAIFMHEVTQQLFSLSTIFVLAILGTIMLHLHQSVSTFRTSAIAATVINLLLLTMVLHSFMLVTSYIEQTIAVMGHFLVAFLPYFLFLLVSVGGFTSAAFFHPTILLFIQTSSWYMTTIVFPLVLLHTIISALGSISETIKLTKLASLLRSLAITALLLFMTVFIGVMSVQGAATTVTDGLAIRTLKFVSSNAVPVVGRVFTDAAETMVNASLLVKNTVGLFALLLLLLVVLLPAIKIAIIACMYYAMAAVVEPLGGNKIATVLAEISKSILLLFASLLVVTFMFFLAIVIIIISGNANVMLR
ncbi:stage III sporulation protein AE [Paenalkalicoccus suaedae]|uniref:Stage III sporulation protein AE n=1 Tax=Paenalkalicoccus suaedae TaxID=2592382 RepID=A0A859FFG8_9BACI|nr:stage III sporulation protein AE [Paenalkalicoccus suaedae]QKS70955.1 stage III sporulation protein AE [Paenalkalicoccus suaedae]